MKSLVLIAIAMSAFSASAATYCRTVKSDGLFGQPAGEREHCVSIDIKKGLLTDNTNTFFGNPPATHKIVIVDGMIGVLSKSGSFLVEYRFKGNALVSESGAVLTKKQN